MVSSAPVAASPCVLLCCQWVCRVILWASCVCADRLLCGAVGTSLLARWVSGVLHGAALPAPVVWRVCRRDEEWWSSAVNGCGLSCGSTSRHSCRRKQKAWKVRLNVVCCILHPGNLLVHTRTPSALATAFNGTNLQPHYTAVTPFVLLLLLRPAAGRLAGGHRFDHSPNLPICGVFVPWHNVPWGRGHGRSGSCKPGDQTQHHLNNVQNNQHKQPSAAFTPTWYATMCCAMRCGAALSAHSTVTTGSSSPPGACRTGTSRGEHGTGEPRRRCT